MNINDTVMHQKQGVCRITDIREESFCGENRLYYVMLPVYKNVGTTIFVPKDNDGKIIRKVLSEDEIREIIKDIQKDPGGEWIDNDKERQKIFDEILKNGSHADIMRMIYAIWKRKKVLKDSGKKIHIRDERIMESAENLIHQEFAYTMDIPLDKVAPFIAGEVDAKTR